MNMQDKEIDQLFKSELADFEAEPLPKVWAAIAGNLDTRKRKIVPLPYLSIAASVLLVIAISGYFVNRLQLINKKPVQIATVKNKMPQKVIIAPKVTVAKVSVNKTNKRHLAVVAQLYKGSKSNLTEPNRPINVTAQQFAVTERSGEVLKPVVPDMETPLHITTGITEQLPVVSAANNLTVANSVIAQVPQSKIITVSPIKKHRIGSFGDLINVVVSKVDKRKDKIIEFTTTDDDESTISGLNLGLIKIKNKTNN